MENDQITKKQFDGLMGIITSDLIAKIASEQNIDDTEAMEKLYSSQLYSKLEIESTKIWHFSTPLLYDLFEQELKTGKIVFPEEN